MIRGSISLSPVADVAISSLPPDQTTKAILEFLGMWFPAFRAEYLVTYPSPIEDRISESLHLYLQEKAKATNLLIRVSEKKGVDFLIFIEPMVISAKPIFVIEAKRLPPTNTKDYVQGRTGGIERFKREQEGFNFDKNHCAMVAYIQQHTFEYWFNQVNQWLTELIANNENYDEFNWEESDKLIAIMSSATDIARYVSNHSRKTLSRLTINHFWLDMRVSIPS